MLTGGYMNPRIGLSRSYASQNMLAQARATVPRHSSHAHAHACTFVCVLPPAHRVTVHRYSGGAAITWPAGTHGCRHTQGPDTSPYSEDCLQLDPLISRELQSPRRFRQSKCARSGMHAHAYTWTRPPRRWSSALSLGRTLGPILGSCTYECP